jgi:hypothetical protein
MRVVVLLASLLLTMLCAGCAKSEYWVAGLTLPPGSTMVSTTETTGVEGPAAAFLPGGGKPEKVLVVSFDNASGWGTVASHVETCMLGQGYTDSMSALAGLAAMMPGSAGAALSSTKMFSKDGSKFVVMAMDMAGVMGAAGQARDVPGMGAYTLTVVKMQ